MISKRICVLALSVVLMTSFIAAGVDMTQIERVRGKEVLDKDDLNVIDDFVISTMAEILTLKDFGSAAGVRGDLVNRANSTQTGAQEQYRKAFTESVATRLSEAFTKAQKIDDPLQKGRVMLNLTILADELDNSALVKVILDIINTDNEAVRYWAVHAVTKPSIIKQLDSQQVQTIVSRMGELAAKETNTEIIGLIADFAGELNTPAGSEMLSQIADKRVEKYAAWKIEDETVDGKILKLLADRTVAESSDKGASAKRFAQLYSYVIQRYVKGADILTATHKKNLISVIVETEKTSVSKLLGTSSQAMKAAIEKNNIAALTAEHESLLGSATLPGRLANAFNFDYGTNADGGKKTAPLVLPEPAKAGG